MSTIVNELFTEKFRPRDLSMLIVPPRVHDELKKGLVQNLLLYGTPGNGKTSTAFILADGHTTKYINASSERGIDTIREDIAQFCSSVSLLDGNEHLKCVILDEIDNATNDFFMALKAVIEKYSKVARFIGTCNFLPKVPDAITSRLHLVAYDPINSTEEKYLIKEYKTRIGLILTKINVSYTDELLEKFVLNNFPDMRSLMNKLQSFYLRNVTALTDENLHTNYDFDDLFKLCVSKPDKPHNNYKFVVNQYGNKVDDALTALGTEFPDYLKNRHPNLEAKIPLVLIAIAEYQYQKAFTIDPMISLLAAMFKLQSILS